MKQDEDFMLLLILRFTIWGVVVWYGNLTLSQYWEVTLNTLLFFTLAFGTHLINGHIAKTHVYS